MRNTPHLKRKLKRKRLCSYKEKVNEKPKNIRILFRINSVKYS